MVDFVPGDPTQRLSKSTSLEPTGVYICPVCRHGQISQMVLMDAFACNFCRHILSVNFATQTIRLEDSSQGFRWQWVGQGWRSLHQRPIELTYTIVVLAILFVLMPPALVWLGYHTFPPLPDAPGQWFPLAWVGLTFLAHLALVLRLCLDLYQPMFIRLRRFL